MKEEEQGCCFFFDERSELTDARNGRRKDIFVYVSVAPVCLSSVCLSNVSYTCGYTVRPRAKVTMASYRKLYNEEPTGTKMNDLDLCIEVV